MDIVKSQQTVQTLIMCVIGMWLPCLPMQPYIQILQYMYTAVVCFGLESVLDKSRVT